MSTTKLLALVCVAVCIGCETNEDEERQQRIAALEASIHAQQEPYLQTVAAFLDATSKQDFERAYGLMAPSYTNMVTREQFVAGIATNKNFERPVELDVYKTTRMSGTLTITAAFGELGRAEISFIDTASGPRISAIVLGGTAVLPGPC